MSDDPTYGEEIPVRKAIKDAFISIIVAEGLSQGDVVTETDIMRKVISLKGDAFSAQELRTAFHDVYTDGIVPTTYVVVGEDGRAKKDADGKLEGIAKSLDSLCAEFETRHGVAPSVMGSHVKLPAIVEQGYREKGTPIVLVDCAFVVA